ncbi:MAG: hypothetical protein ABSG78_10560 [Verrucomicrobiota bacterium]
MNSYSKTEIGMVLLILLAGCGGNAEKKRMDAMELRMASLESTMSNLNERQINHFMTNMQIIVRSIGREFTNDQRIDSLSQSMLLSAEASQQEWGMVSNLLARVDKLESPTNRTGRSLTTVQPRLQSASAMKEGIPIEIYNQISAEAAKDWPGDYRMQVSRIEHEVEAYKKLHP